MDVLKAMGYFAVNFIVLSLMPIWVMLGLLLAVVSKDVDNNITPLFEGFIWIKK